MLKQPLLSRMFKLSGSAPTPSEKPTSIEKSESDQAKLTLEKTLEAKSVEEKTQGKTLVEKALVEDPSSRAPISAAASAPSSTNDSANAVLDAEIIGEQLSKRLDRKTDDVDNKTDIEESGVAQKVPKRKRLSRGSILKLAAAFGLLATGSGFAVARTSPETLQTVLPAADKPAPLSFSSDPTAEPVMKAGDLFLTNQILYRKLEAIAGVSLTAPTPPASTTAAISTATDKPTATKDNNAASTSIDSKPASTQKAGSKNAEAEKAEESTKPNPDVNVVADAPPAPVIAPVDFSGTTIDSVLEMRVAVAKDVPAIGFATSSSGVITDLDGNTLKALSAEQGVTAEISGGVVVEGETMPSAFWVYPEDGGYVAVGDSWYRGRVLIALRERGLIAVNHVLLGDYLYSVVGTEMSADWPIESLKAQAIAARSYALTHNIHPASQDYFDLDNTQRFQAYKGLSREASTTQAAVQATAGEFISHEGGIVESLYAASQSIVDDAHKGSGMSQLGAKDLAQQGYSYQEILAHYYPGTALGRLETDQE